MTLVITRAQPEERIDAARLMADTMAGFGVAVLGAGDEGLELRALAQWFRENNNRFSYQFAHFARWEGETAGLLLCFPGRDVERLSLACRHSILKLYSVRNLAKLIWRGMVIGRTREAEKDEFLVAHVAVFEQFRRKGIATALLEKATVLAKEAGYSRVVLEVEIGNTAAIECYQRFGFVIQFTTNFGRHTGLLQCPGFHKMLLQL
jgi:ribosomal protein S18 acetylase RimI-like enzyme